MSADKKLQRIVANRTGTTRMDSMGDRDYLVVPMIMMTEGVHTGDGGSLLYRNEDLSKNPSLWNHKPVVVYHPQKNGKGISACDPDVITNRGIGVIMNAFCVDGKLKAEAWLEPAKMDKVDNRISKAIENDEMMELSTGLFTDNEVTEGDWNGEAYEAIATNYGPDHLAILPDLKGACSIKDGAGFLRTNAAKDGIELEIGSLGKDEQQYILANKNKVVERINSQISTFISNEISHSNVHSLLNSLLRVNDDDLWIDEVFETFFIYVDDGRLYKQNYLIADDSASFVGDRIEVVRVVEFRTLSGDFVGNNERNDDMEKKDIVKALIENESTQWKKEDESELMKLEECVLKKMNLVVNKDVKKSDEKPVEKPAADVEAASTTPAPTGNMTMESFLSKAPVECQEAIQEMVTNHNAMKTQFITVITANARNTFASEQLTVKGLGELRSLAALATDPQKQVVNSQIAFNYDGQGDVVGTGHKEEPLLAPTMNFGKAKEAQTQAATG